MSSESIPTYVEPSQQKYSYWLSNVTRDYFISLLTLLTLLMTSIKSIKVSQHDLAKKFLIMNQQILRLIVTILNVTVTCHKVHTMTYMHCITVELWTELCSVMQIKTFLLIRVIKSFAVDGNFCCTIWHCLFTSLNIHPPSSTDRL